MDVVLEGFDVYIFDYIYALLPLPSMPAPQSTYQWEPASRYLSFKPSEYVWMGRWGRENIYRQFTTVFLITWIFGLVIYFIRATFSYVFIFDKTTFTHTKYFNNQISLEIAQAMVAIPVVAFFTAPIFVAEVRGYSKMYDTTPDGPGVWYDIIQFPFFIIFTDFCIYWIHRCLHHPKMYKHLHKPHHKWIMPSPYASHAFHPLDGYVHSLPYHIFPFFFPLQKFAYIFFFAFVNIWTVLIRDGGYLAKSPIIIGAACHTKHHLYFNHNYGQYTTLWDRLGGSYRKSDDELFREELKIVRSEREK
ncbi:C-5 sterol desaturas-like protein [Macrophomina phaseolina]|uniref:C-5 sterol desaturas-like protein n=1 Tax=Macrophomina phaseolina TaxID=35725 RepID=A0ABQ8G2T2_9PEZI|nr:C-5 sterol desaturas-like protein [Macrophomina phaseolina]